VSVTVLSPTLEQLKLEGDTLSVTPQASFEPLSTCAAVIVAVPAELRLTVMFLAIALGATVSRTVTVAFLADTLLFASVTVSVTVLAPVFVQSNEEGDTLNVTPHASFDPSSTWAAVIDAVPEALR
jgi:hypothetical protein